MKKIILIVALVFTAVSLWSFSKIEKVAVSKDGIDFMDGNLKQALEKAKAKNKYVFIDVYASWCGVCKKLKRKSFKDKEVGDYYNKNFINIAINGESNEGKEVVRSYGVQGYPTLLIVDAQGKLKTKQVGFVAPHILVNFGKRIVP